MSPPAPRFASCKSPKGTLNFWRPRDHSGALAVVIEPRRNSTAKISIRINDQWRVCFIWTGTDATEVEITDYL